MMRYLMFIVLTLVVMSIFVEQVYSQETKSARLIGQILAFDRTTSLTALHSTSQEEIYVVHIEKILQGKVKGSVILVKYRFFQSDKAMLDRVRSGDHQWRMNVRRNKGCDSTINTLVRIESEGPGSSIPTFSRIEWLTDMIEVDRDLLLPCYSLEAKGVFLESGFQKN